MPALWIVCLALMPGGAAAFRVPDPSILASFASALGAAFFTALLLEELGWRGFALPRLQARYGPLAGTLFLGVLWGLWHLPLRALLPGLEGADGGPVEFMGAFGMYVAETMGGAILITWIYNHARGSLLLALLLHASTNAAGATIPSGVFPGLVPAGVIPLAFELGTIVVAVLVVLGTRGRLGYPRPDGAVIGPGPGHGRGPAPRSTPGPNQF
jgi:membrane protease YdiL (CAAX protease family)